MKKEKETKKDYQSPLTKETQVEMEDRICASSGEPVKDRTQVHVEVDDWVKVDDNEVTFD